MLTPTVSSVKAPVTSALNTASEPHFSSMLERDLYDRTEPASRDVALADAMSNFVAERRKLAVRKLNKNRTNPTALLEIANVHFSQKRYEKAKDTYLNALRVDKLYLAAFPPLIESLIALGKPGQAVMQAERGLKVAGGDNLNLWLKKLLAEIVALKMGVDEKYISLDEVKSDFKRVLERYDGEIEPTNLYGMFFAINLEDHSKAIEQFKRNLGRNPKHIDSLNNTGLSYWLSGDKLNGVKYLKQAILIDPSYPNAYSNLVSLYIDMQHYDDALGILRSAEERGIGILPNLKLLKAQLLAQTGEFREALEIHQEIYESNKTNHRYLNNIGYCYDKLGKSKEAIKYYKRSINIILRDRTLENDSLHSFYNLMILARAMKQHDLVQETAKSLLSIKPDDAGAYYFINNEGIGRGNAGFAKQALQRRIEIDPQDIGAYVTLSFILATINGKHEEAISLLENGPLDLKKDGSAQNNLAYSYIKTGRLDDAERVLDSTNEPSSFDNHMTATRGLLKLYRGDFEGARKLYEKAIKHYSDDDRSKSFAMQVWDYEQANYHWLNGMMTEALKAAERAFERGDVSYAYEDTRSLLKKIKASLKNA